ncbi:MAG: alpha/beta hydrolase [Candidatus Caldarchaeum sp.]
MVSWSEHFQLGSKVDVDGVDVFYIDRGDGEAVVLLHGWASSSFSWRFNWPVLAQHYRVVVPDFPGFGYSQKLPTKPRLKALAEHIVKFLNKIGVAQFYLAGMSMGGAIASYLAANYPGHVRKLVLINPALFGSRFGARRIPVRLLSVKPFYNLFSWMIVRKSFIRNVVKQVYLKPALQSAEMVEAYYQSVKLAGTTLVDAMYIISDFDLTYVRNVRCPVLFVLGGRDNLVPYELNRKLAEEIGARVFIDLEAGHAVHEENPDVVNNVILDFLKA